MADTLPVVYLTGNHDFHYTVMKPSSTTGLPVVADGETVVGMFCSAEPTIGASSLTASALGSTSTAMPGLADADGRYLGTLTHANKVTALGSLVDGRVYEVITIGGIVVASTEVLVKRAVSA